MRLCLIASVIAISTAFAAIAAEGPRDIDWENLAPEYASIDDPFTHLSPDQRLDLFAILGIRKQVEEGLTPKESPTYQMGIEMTAKLKSQGLQVEDLVEKAREIERIIAEQDRRTVPELQGQKVKMPGFALPLEFSDKVIAGGLVDAFGWRITMWGAAIAGLLLSAAVYVCIGRRPTMSTEDAPSMRAILSGFAVALRNRRVWLVAGGGAIAAAPIFIFGSLWGVPFLMQVHGLERTVAASLTATALAGWGFGAFLSGWLSDRIGERRKPIICGLAIAFLALTVAIYGPKLPVFALGVLLLVAGLGSGVVVLSYAMAGDLSSAASRGSAYAFANMLMILSGAIFQPVVGWLLDLNWSGSTSTGARVYDVGAFETAFLTVPVTYIAGLVMILLSRYDEPNASRPSATP